MRALQTITHSASGNARVSRGDKTTQPGAGPDSAYEALAKAQLRRAIEESKLQGSTERKAHRDEAGTAPN